MKSEALLTGRIYDDRGNRMTPSHTRKGNVRYPLPSSRARPSVRARSKECRQLLLRR
jgi:hypothetical protein